VPPAAFPARMLSKEFVTDAYRNQVNLYGKVLSQDAFMRQTGIANYHWRGGYWRSWSEFQASLGFTPNKRPEKYSDEYILRCFGELALRLKRLPTDVDIRLWRKQDPFPSRSAYERLGSRDQRLMRLEAFCEGKPEFAPVAALLEERRAQFAARRRGYRRVRGFVYLARAGEPGLMMYRLGHERGGCKRVRRLATRQWCLPGTMHVIDTDDPKGIERYWRERFRPFRLRRNRYRLEWDDVLAFRLRRFQ
jgi:hypothetical protein